MCPLAAPVNPVNPTTCDHDAVQSDAATPREYLDGLPDDRRPAIEAVRDVIVAHLPEGYVETMQYGMISYVVPLERRPDTYNGQPLAVASLANQKRHMALYLSGLYASAEDAAWFRARWAETGKKLDMGKSCLRFRTLDAVDLGLVGEAIARIPVDRFLELNDAARR